MKKRRIIRLIVLITILGAASFFAYIFLKPVANDGSQGSYLMGDFTGNGKEELLIASQVFSEPRTHVLKLIDTETKEIVWKNSYAHGYRSSLLFEPCLSDTILVLKDSYHIEDIASKEQLGNIDLLGFNGKTGELIWKKSILDSLQWQYYKHTELFSNNKDVYIFSEQWVENSKFCYLLRINPINGEILWKAIIPDEYDFNPKFIGNNKIVINDYRSLFCIENSSGKTFTLNDEENYLNVFSQDDEAFYFLTFENIFRCDTAKHLVREYDKQEPRSQASVLNFDDYCIYDDKLLCFNKRSFDTPTKYSIEAIPFDDTEETREYEIEDGYWAETRFLEDDTRLIKSALKTNGIDTRYILLQLKRFDRSTRFVHDSIDLDLSKLVIFDMQEVKAIWESKKLKDLHLLNYAKSGDYSYFAYFFPYRDTTKRVKLSFNGETGKFHKAVSFEDMPIEHLSAFDEQKFAHKHIYYSNDRITWCLSFPELELKYSTEEINVQDANAILEEVFSNIPWEENELN